MQRHSLRTDLSKIRFALLSLRTTLIWAAWTSGKGACNQCLHLHLVQCDTSGWLQQSSLPSRLDSSTHSELKVPMSAAA